MTQTRKKHKWMYWASILFLLLLVFLTAARYYSKSIDTGDILSCSPVSQFLFSIVMTIAPIQMERRNPVDPNQAVEWSKGPETQDLQPGERPPNVIVILADDMGFNDVSYYNGGTATFQTPRIDRIAKEGVAFMNGYAGNATCAPSRAAIMTGRYATRFGYEFTPIFKVGFKLFELMNTCNTAPHQVDIDHELAKELPSISELGMPSSEITIAEKLKEAGYHTVHIGKWHLGGTEGMRPEDQGFDESLDMAGALYMPEDSPGVVNARLDFSGVDTMVWAAGQYAARFNGGKSFEPSGYLTDYYTEEAVKVIEANRNRPFFLYLAHWGIHNPLQAKKEDYDALAHIGDHSLRVYAAMIRALDRGVGKVMDALKENGLDDNTLVIFTSDNGGAGYLGLPNINKPYRGWKLTFFEGGLHVPFFARWPGRIAPGTVYDKPVAHIDIFATAAAAAGVPVPDDRKIDSIDLFPYITGANIGEPHDALFWRSSYYRTVLSGGWKMQVSDRPDKVWLYNLEADPTERVNLAKAHPAKVAELKALLHAHNAEQAEPLWPSALSAPVLMDKTDKEQMLESDEYVYWPN